MPSMVVSTLKVMLAASLVPSGSLILTAGTAPLSRRMVLRAAEVSNLEDRFVKYPTKW